MNGEAEGKASGSYVEARAVSELDETLDAEGSRGAGVRIGRFRSRVLCPQVHFDKKKEGSYVLAGGVFLHS